MLSLLIATLVACSEPAPSTRPDGAGDGAAGRDSAGDSSRDSDREDAFEVDAPTRGRGGDPCRSDGDCTSTLCVEGVCCNELCPACQRCAMNTGECAPRLENSPDARCEDYSCVNRFVRVDDRTCAIAANVPGVERLCTAAGDCADAAARCTEPILPGTACEHACDVLAPSACMDATGPACVSAARATDVQFMGRGDTCDPAFAADEPGTDDESAVLAYSEGAETIGTLTYASCLEIAVPVGVHARMIEILGDTDDDSLCAQNISTGGTRLAPLVVIAERLGSTEVLTATGGPTSLVAPFRMVANLPDDAETIYVCRGRSPGEDYLIETITFYACPVVPT